MTSGTFKESSFDWHISSKVCSRWWWLLRSFLMGILSVKQVHIKAHAARLGRWAADFMTMNLKVYHLPGYRNIPPDIICRWMKPEATGEEEIPAKIVTRAEEEYWKLVDCFHVSGRRPSRNGSPAASWGGG
eukprot:maker-scaffold_39-snap-gene-2.78-mRNA-1 protein AED:0.60 eAED:0.66 QI:0/0/0/1/0/0/2/0/130